jgi:hypothetical protein
VFPFDCLVPPSPASLQQDLYENRERDDASFPMQLWQASRFAFKTKTFFQTSIKSTLTTMDVVGRLGPVAAASTFYSSVMQCDPELQSKASNDNNLSMRMMMSLTKKRNLAFQ